MSRCYLDTNFLYAHLRSEPKADGRVDDWRDLVVDELDTDSAVVSALVYDELAYRLVLAWLRDDGETDPLLTYRAEARTVMRRMRRRFTATWKAVDALGLEFQPTESAVVRRAKALMATPGLAPRDAFHAAHAVEADCEVVASSDSAFDHVAGLRRLVPPG